MLSSRLRAFINFHANSIDRNGVAGRPLARPKAPGHVRRRKRIVSMVTQPGNSSARITVIYERHTEQNPREFRGVVQEDFYALRIALCRGKVTLISDGKSLHSGAVWPGMMRLTSPGEELRGVVYTPSEAVVLHIPGPHLRATLQTLHPKHRPGDVTFVNPLLKPHAPAEQLGRLALHAKQYDPVHAQLFVAGITDSLLACLLYHHGIGEQGKKNTKGFHPGEFRRAVDFAEARLLKTLKLATWANVLQMPTPEFTRRFRATTGTSPYAWFMQRRIDRARELLRATNTPLCDVALRVGFCSQSHFTDAFRRVVGVSPARWRQEQTS